MAVTSNTIRLDIMFLRLLEQTEPNLMNSECVIKHKREVRKYLNRPLNPWRLVKSYGISGYIVVGQIEGATDIESARKLFEANHYIEYRPSMYDCTGQLFTNWYKVFERNGKYYAYHAIGCDV